MKKTILTIAIIFISIMAFSQRHKRNDFGNKGRYIGGHGSSHRGGRYHSRIGNGDRYSRHSRKKR